MKITRYGALILVAALAACDEGAADADGGADAALVDRGAGADKTISPAKDKTIAADTKATPDGPATKPDLAAGDGPQPTPAVVNAATLSGKVMFG